MAFLSGLLGGGSDPADIYGDLFTEKQRAALRDQQLTDTLLRLSAGFAKAGQASRLPTGGLLGAIGEAAGGLAGTGDEAMNRQLKGMQIAEQVRQSQQERAILAKAAPYVEAIMKRFNLDRGTATQVAAQMAGGGGAPPAATGAPTGGPFASNAPPPPAPAYPSGDVGGPVPGGFPGDFPGDVAAPAKAAGLLPPPSQTDPWAQYAGLLGGGRPGGQSPFDPTTLDPTAPGSPDRRIQIEPLSGEAAPADESARLSRLMQVETFPKPATAAHINYGGTGVLGNPAEAGWRNSNIVPVPAPGGARFDVHRAAAPDFAGFLQDLSALGYKIDPKTSSSYNYRNIRGSDHLSEHAYGTAIDINSNANLYTRDGRKVTDLPPEVGALAAKHNLEWGGNWKDPVDTMHFQWRGSDRGAPPPADSRLAALTRRYESGDRNIVQQVNATGTAGGYYQITDPTWRDIAPKAGIDLEKYPTAISAPREVQDAAASALRQTRGMQPWSSNRPLMAAIGERGFSGRIEPLGGDAAPAGSGEIPGLGVQPEALAALNAMLKMGGMKSDPFGSLLETYYKSPEYLKQSEQVKKDVELETQPKIEAAKAQATQQYIQANDKFKSELEIAKELMVRGGMVQQPDGSYKVITSVQEGLAAVDNAKKTGDIKEYEYYSQNERDRGGIAKPFAVWDAERRKASATSINTTEGLEAAQTKARIAVDQDMAKDANTKALVASQLMPLLDQAMTIARTTPEGFAGPAYKTFGQLAGALGIAVPPGSSNAELLGAINQRMIPMVREPGATAASEMDKYLSAGPALANTADGRVKIIEMTKAINLRAIEVARVIRNNIGAPDLHEKLKALDTPVFSDDQRAAMDAAVRAGVTPPATGGAPLPAGAIRTPYGIIERISP